jgi:hypothetical protein
MKKIIVISWTPFKEIDFYKWDFSSLIKRQNIIVYDITRVIFPLYPNCNYHNKLVKVLKFVNLKRLLSKIKSLTNINLIINLSGISTNHKIYLNLLKKNVPIVTFKDSGLHISCFYPFKIYFYLKLFIKKIFAKKINYSNEINLGPGSCLLNRISNINKTHISSHSINYDIHLRNKFKFKEKKRKIAVYLDSAYGEHPDFIINKISKKFNLMQYKKKINCFFLFLKKIGYKIYFLPHPKSSKKYLKLFKHCQFAKKNMTYKYIRVADLVIAVNSKAIEFAVILKKKIIKIYTDEIKSYPAVYKSLMRFARFFSIKAFKILDQNVSHFINFDDYILKPNSKYQDYINTHIKDPNSKNIKISEIIKKILRKNININKSS